ncbi:MAG: preprotein translocase subunit SecG [Alistipes sp.]|nr:preprotein translocase subunit SecG [Alistipes sp.]
MLYNICIVLILIASILLILAVLVQSPKSGMAANFGAANQVMGVRESANVLEKVSWWLAGIIAVLSVLATTLHEGKSGNDLNDDLARHQSGSTEQVDKTTAFPNALENTDMSAQTATPSEGGEVVTNDAAAAEQK